jgi:Fic family protein
MAVSRDGNWTGWRRFFLEAVQKQAEENQSKALKIINLYSELKPRIAELTRSQYSIHALDWLFARPIFRSSDFIESAGIPKATGKRILAIMKKYNKRFMVVFCDPRSEFLPIGNQKPREAAF